MIRMRLNSRPCLPTGLIFLVLLQLAFKVSLQEEISPNEGACNEGAIQALQLKMIELQDHMDKLKETNLKIFKVILGSEGTIVGHTLFKRFKGGSAKDQWGTFQVGKENCDVSLALPKNAAENEALQSILEQPDGPAVLGLSYNSAKNQFEDVDGQPVYFFNWAPGKPNDLRNKECVAMHLDGQWHNIDCKVSHTIICGFNI